MMTGSRCGNIPVASEASKFYLNDLTHRVVANTGRYDDRHHLGKIILQNLRDNPDFVMQIDGATGESETFGSVLKRSVQCANGFRKLGLKTGDVVILMAPNHLDLTIPFYAALYLGITIAPIDMMLKVSELEDIFRIDVPNIIFCQNEKLSEVLVASKVLEEKPEIITFDKSEVPTFADFLQKYGNDVSAEDFRASDFSPRSTLAILLSTSGTTGKPKSAAVSHRSFVISLPYFWLRFTKFPTPTRLPIIVSPIQWLSAIVHYLGAPVFKYTRLQSSLPATQQHTYEMINKYRPSYIISSPTMLTTLIKPVDRDSCDFSCFETILVGGGAVPDNLIEDAKKFMPNVDIEQGYGMSEATTLVFLNIGHAPGSCGKPHGLFQYKLVDPITGEGINVPHKPGELWIQSEVIFSGYYNDPKATAEIYEDGWLKSGDIFYRDENWNFFFVDRLKLLLKYKNHQIINENWWCNSEKNKNLKLLVKLDKYINKYTKTMCCQRTKSASQVVAGDEHTPAAQQMEAIKEIFKFISPVEVEGVIRQHPAVLDVAVVGLPDPECGELPVACVVPKPGYTIVAQEIKDLVKNTLADSKQLRGGVVVMSELPLTATTKLHRQKLYQIVLTAKRE